MFVKDNKSGEYLWLNSAQVESFRKIGPGIFELQAISSRLYTIKFFGDLEALRRHMIFTAQSPPPEDDRQVVKGDQPVPDRKGTCDLS